MAVRHAVLLSCAALAACADLPLEQAKTTRLVVESEKGSEATYRTLIASARACYPSRGVRVDGDYFAQSQAGVMTLTMAFDFNAIGLLRAEVEPAGAKSRVVATYRESAKAFADAVPRWLAGDASVCPYR